MSVASALPPGDTDRIASRSVSGTPSNFSSVSKRRLDSSLYTNGHVATDSRFMRSK